MNEKLLTIAEAADICVLSRKTMYAMVAAGEVPCVRFGPRVVRIPAPALRAWIDGKTSAAPRSTAMHREPNAVGV